MSRNKLTLEVLLRSISDGELLDVQNELLSGIVPATGAAHGMCRRINRMIDRGDLCINPTTYRKVYLPTLAKAVQRELSSRYVKLLTGQVSTEETIGQLTLSLVNKDEQATMEATSCTK